jgi:tetratricopeptide (TPR) repeat protein
MKKKLSLIILVGFSILIAFFIFSYEHEMITGKSIFLDNSKLQENAIDNFWKGNYDKSISKFEKLLKIEPKNEVPYIYLFWIYFQEPYKDLDQALEIAEKYNFKSNNNIHAQSLNLILHLNLDNMDKANQFALDVIKSNEEFDLKNWALALYYSKNGKKNKAKEYFVKYLKSESVYFNDTNRFSVWLFHDVSTHIVNNYDLEFAEEFFLPIIDKKIVVDDLIYREAKQYLSRKYRDEGKYREAENLILDINNACSYQALGALYSKMEITNKALDSYKLAGDDRPNDDNIQFIVALNCFKYGDYECSLKYIDNAIKLRPDAEVYKEFKGFILLALNQINDAKNIFERLKINKKAFLPKTGLGHIEILNKDYDKARELFLLCIDEMGKTDFEEYEHIHKLSTVGEYKDLNKKMIYLGLGWTYANQNMHEEALQYYEYALDVWDKDLVGLTSKANSLIAIGKNNESLQVLEKALKIYPGNMYLIEALGLVKLNRGNFKGAKKQFNDVLKLNNKTYTCPYEGLGLIYYKTGEYEKAKQNLIKSIEINPDIEYKKYNTLAKIYIEEGNINDAKELLIKSIENYPYDDEAKNLLNEIN